MTNELLAPDGPAGATTSKARPTVDPDSTVTQQVRQSLGELVSDFELLILEMRKEALRRASVCREWERRFHRAVEGYLKKIEISRTPNGLPPALVLLLGPVATTLRDFWFGLRHHFRCVGNETTLPNLSEGERRFLSLLFVAHVRDANDIRDRVQKALDAVFVAATDALKVFRESYAGTEFQP